MAPLLDEPVLEDEIVVIPEHGIGQAVDVGAHADDDQKGHGKEGERAGVVDLHRPFILLQNGNFYNANIKNCDSIQKYLGEISRFARDKFAQQTYVRWRSISLGLIYEDPRISSQRFI